jgi:hypothetical protein
MTIKGVRASVPGDEKASPRIGRIKVAPATAEVVRKVAKHLGWTLDRLVQAMLTDWVPQNTDLILETDAGEVDPTCARAPQPAKGWTSRQLAIRFLEENAGREFTATEVWKATGSTSSLPAFRTKMIQETKTDPVLRRIEKMGYGRFRSVALNAKRRR